VLGIPSAEPSGDCPRSYEPSGDCPRSEPSGDCPRSHARQNLIPST
jgi:hypothetical protein